MTDLTPEKLAEIRTLATNTRNRTVLSLLDALDEKERELASAWEAGHSAGFTQCARGVDDDLADTFYGKKTNPHKAKP